MGFADAYLLKAGLRESLIAYGSHSDLKLIVTIPVHNESGLARCLDSLFRAGLHAHGRVDADANKTLETLQTLENPPRFEVLILVNAPADAPSAVLEQNLATRAAAEAWIATHPHPLMDFYVLLDHSFGKKEAGVGMARKILMDEAARRFSTVGNPDGIIASMDADAVVDPNYFSALLSHFKNSQPEGCSILFEHPLEGEDFSPFVYDAITQYELHLRYYLSAVRSTCYPHAFHTVGSAFAVRAGIYCMEGGMNKRQGGEDFYFIQKIAQRGNWSECNTTRVQPSPRPSDRVPFGTGPVVRRLSREAEATGVSPILSTYNPEPFGMLREFFSGIDRLYVGSAGDADSLVRGDSDDSDGFAIMDSLPGVLSEFLVLQGFDQALEEIRSNSGSAEAFRKRFWRWFNMFRIMKFMHYAREHGYPDVDVGDAGCRFLSLEIPCSLRELLETFRSKG